MSSARPGLPWSELLELHVVKKVAQIAHQRWRLGLGYSDALARTVRPPRAPRLAAGQGVCRVIQDREAGERACQSTAFEIMGRLVAGADQAHSSAAPILVTCHAGLSELAAPILIDGACVGALLCGGFFAAPPGRALDDARQDALATLDRRTGPLALGPEEYRAARDRHPWLSAEEISFAGDLVRAAAEEVASYCAERVRAWRRRGDLESAFAVRYSYDAIIGKSPPMQELYSVLDRVVQSDTTVLIQGENGTGKELVARAIHHGSARRHRRFVITNCSSFNDNLLDSELFGHKRGAFTGAFADKQGLFEVADMGTFFLDEIGDMSPALQVKVLRVLQEGTFTPVGDTETRKVDVRIIAATNRDLEAMVARGTFREDLYYRINVINLRIPPLRERHEDIALLVDRFLAKHRRGRPGSKTLTPACIQRLLQYDWPGNVRELENEIERLVVLAGDERVLDEPLLSRRIREPAPRGKSERPIYSLPEAVRRLERQMIVDSLERHDWNKTRASAELEISRRNLIRLVQKYDLESERDV